MTKNLDEVVGLHGRVVTVRERIMATFNACRSVSDMRTLTCQIEALVEQIGRPSLSSSDAVGVVDALRGLAATSGTAVRVGGYCDYRDVSDIARDAARLVGEMQAHGDPELREALARISDLEDENRGLRDALHERQIAEIESHRVAA